jgi:hypothetical protein
MDADLTGRRLASTPIAIVGMSGLFPMARTHRENWQNVVAGTDCIHDVPESRWSLADCYDSDRDAPDKIYSRRGGFFPDVEFDPVEFGLPPNQLGITSTMQLLSLGVARDLLCDAGAPESRWYDPPRTGGRPDQPAATHQPLHPHRRRAAHRGEICRPTSGRGRWYGSNAPSSTQPGDLSVPRDVGQTPGGWGRVKEVPR